MIEALILGVPVVPFGTDLDFLRERGHPMGTILDPVLGCLTLRDGVQAKNLVLQALSEGYLTRIESSLALHEEELFHKLDGRCGARVGEVLIEAAARKRGPTS
jgi:hypothetical protein